MTLTYHPHHLTISFIYSLSASTVHISETACGRTDQVVCRVCLEREVPIEAVAVDNDLNQIVEVAIPVHYRSDGHDDVNHHSVEQLLRQTNQLLKYLLAAVLLLLMIITLQFQYNGHR